MVAAYSAFYWANAGPIGLSTTGPISIKRWSSVRRGGLTIGKSIVAECRPSATAVVRDEIEARAEPPIRRWIRIADTGSPSSSWEGVIVRP